ncbi:MAG: bifunctional diaminohydroxyphosphoribosylaminopyrimidine deaminase/5-amino-6-(5-phosphoribosylamino)uracil reductase RibD, partial [Ilumatobacteraceae bacterium]
MDEAEAMAHAVEHAASVRSRTSPNPWVGAVVLDARGRVVGVGATAPAGGAHAEVIAITAAGAATVGATLVVTLEPCSHHGRTPPCVGAIVAAGIARVVVGVNDPDRRVAGRGVAGLRAAGVTVEVGLLGDQVTAQLRPYLHHRRTGRPYVVCKLATTLDGGLAAPGGSSQWITGQEARTDAHRLRAESDAIIVGAGTIRAD